MIPEKIKEILGEDLALEVEDALRGAAKDGGDVVLAVANDGSYVPAEKHDQMKAEAKRAAEGLRAEFEVELARAKKAALVEAVLSDVAFDAADVMPLVDLEALDLAACGEAGRKAAVNAALLPVRQAKPYLFKPEGKAEKPLEVSGAKPAVSAGRQEAAGVAGPSVF